MKAVIVKLTSGYHYDEHDRVKVTDNWDYTRDTIKVGCKFGKNVYTWLDHRTKYSEWAEKVEILEVVGDIPRSHIAYKDHTEHDRLAAESYLEYVEAIALHKYALPLLVDSSYSRNYGWINRKGVFYSGNYAQHSYIAARVCEAIGVPDNSVGEYALTSRGYLRVTPLCFGYDMKLPVTIHQKFALDALLVRFEKSYGYNDALAASYYHIMGLGIGDE